MKKLALLVMAALLALGVLTACGGGGGGSAAATEITVELGANNQWKFTPDVVTVNQGDNVKVTLVNKDPAQPHTFIVPALNVKSEQVPIGKTGSVTFKADKKGEFPIECDVPGHKEAGMVGKLIVK